MSNKAHELRQSVTNQIIELLETVDVNEYQPPFTGLASQGIPENPTTNHSYQGINILTLWFNQNSKSFSSNEWATFKQWKAQGAHVRKGEKGSRIIFYKTLVQKENDKSGNEQEHKIPMLKTYTVFNANQVDGYVSPDQIPASKEDQVKRIKLVDQFCENTGADIRTGENRAYYDASMDYINMPETHSFIDTPQADATENYYSTLLHELTHWTGAKHRLNRFEAKQKPSQEEYAYEELVAELGAAFLCAHHGITQTQPDHHAIYIKSWLKALKNDSKHIFKAAAAAMKSVQYLDSRNCEALDR